MKYKLLMDHTKRIHFKKHEIKRLSLKILYRLGITLKTNIFAKSINGARAQYFFTKIKNRCFITGRSKSIYAKLKLSRIKLREITFHGITKDCW
jgi:ribosomal protein S14